MARFNQKNTGTKTVNLAGGEAYQQTAELELVSILLTSFANDQFYRSGGETIDRLKQLILDCDKMFVAKAAVYARTRFGMRSISHVVASELSKYISGKDWAKDFYASVIYRPDDMTEILSYQTANGGKIPNAMKKGFAKAFGKFNAYSLAKYKGEGRKFKLIDVVNLVHPKANDSNREAIAGLVSGTLKSFDTWESQLTTAGQKATNEDELQGFKKEVWANLIAEKKIGYFALLRNLRNIIEQAPESIPAALALLTDETMIKKSLVLPFRFLTAFEQIQQLSGGKIVREVLLALNKAIDISVSNVPVFDGETLVVLDESGSMEGRPKVIGSLFTAALAKSNNADIILFSNDARYININTADSVTTIANSIPFHAGGTNFHSIFQRANRKYDRIIILSDMQGWMGYTAPTREFANYCQSTGANPIIYSFDLQGYGTMQMPQNRIYCLAGFSDKVFDIMKLLEQDKNALVSTIEKVEFGEKDKVG